MLFHSISPSDVHSGDHLYRWRNFKMLQGIAVQQNDGAFQTYVVMSDSSNTFRLVTLSEFRGNGQLKRAIYDQDNSWLHRIKLTGTSFTEQKRPAPEIVRNALLLLETTHRNPQYIQEVFPDGTNDFARLCCTTSHEQWRNKLQRNKDSLSTVNNFKQVFDLVSTTPVDADEDQIKELEEKIEGLERKQSCCICMDRACNVAFSCGHLACSECANHINQCHICRKRIRQKTTLFWA